jgi:hypothetical protein
MNPVAPHSGKKSLPVAEKESALRWLAKKKEIVVFVE